MPLFRVSGKSPKGRQVSRTVSAQTEAGARRKAEDDGVVVVSVERLPSEPAADRQLSYARSLGIPIPDSPTLDQMSDLISRAVEQPACMWLVTRAGAVGADLAPDRYLGVDYVSRQLNEAIGVNTQALVTERVFWYLHSVLRHRRKKQWQSPDESGVPDEAIWSLAEAFAADASAIKSVQRDCGERLGYSYATFGDGYGGTFSMRTAAYVKAIELLTQSGML